MESYSWHSNIFYLYFAACNHNTAIPCNQFRLSSENRKFQDGFKVEMADFGSAFIKNLGRSDLESHSVYVVTIFTTSLGSPSMGIWRGQVRVGRRSSPVLRKGRR